MSNFQIGDRVSFDGKTGTIENVRTKRVRGVQTTHAFVKTDDGRLHMQFLANIRKTCRDCEQGIMHRHKENS